MYISFWPYNSTIPSCGECKWAGLWQNLQKDIGDVDHQPVHQCTECSLVSRHCVLNGKPRTQGVFMRTGKTDQTGQSSLCSVESQGPKESLCGQGRLIRLQVPRLIWVFAGHTSHFVSFVVLWLKFKFKASESELTGDLSEWQSLTRARRLVPSSHQRSELTNFIVAPSAEDLGEKATLINISISNGDLISQRMIWQTSWWVCAHITPLTCCIFKLL